ncbi:hypothetical protein Tsubulata_017090 [Turnera subulata]|uniref:Uncharacterized protein n=1 Tax=Turnera subulata TaxID=218843 RepID=A0A9Q0G602_9ROSI|nr:hypothetical protein Tsubulata_017090 [Turnera subulata]
MKKLIRKLSRVGHSAHYSRLRKDRSTTRRLQPPGTSKHVPAGHIPVYVGLEEAERFIVNAKLLHHPIFIELLNISAQEYGYDQSGVLKIPVHVPVFKRVLESVYLGQGQFSCLDEVVRSVCVPAS